MIRVFYHALLNSQLSPFGLGHQVVLGNKLGQVLRQHDVTILELLVDILVRVVDVLRGHSETLGKR
jgi:hypothetical protein